MELQPLTGISSWAELSPVLIPTEPYCIFAVALGTLASLLPDQPLEDSERFAMSTLTVCAIGQTSGSRGAESMRCWDRRVAPLEGSTDPLGLM